MLIGYKGPWLLYIVYLLVRCMDKVSLPNIVSGKSIIAELVQHRFNVSNIVYETEKILYDSQYRNNMIKNLSGVKELLSEKYSAQEVAECINNFL